MKKISHALLICLTCVSHMVFGQGSISDTSSTQLTLTECIQYALHHQPALKQSYINETIAKTNNLIGFSYWLPQINGTANYQHYFTLPTGFINNNGTLLQTRMGLPYTSIPSVNATQTIFNNDVLIAARAARLNTRFAKQSTETVKIELVSDVTRSFYDILFTLQQINVLKEDTARLNRNQSDAYYRYQSGVVDKVDYKQATISLNNSLAQLKMATESLQPKYAMLKQLMGYPAEQGVTVNYDTTRMMQEVFIDTAESLDYLKRIEYQQLLTSKRLLRETTMYYQLGFIPSLSAFYTHNFQFQSNTFDVLYNRAYPNNLWGLSLNIPLFTGFRRLENIKKAKLQEQRTDWEIVNLKSQINTEYRQALANYKGNLYYLQSLQDNVQLASEVYNIVNLQYREGIKVYLDVIMAQADLRTSQINYLNAMFQLLVSKIELQKAMGNITPDM